jgi:hypothetical protein
MLGSIRLRTESHQLLFSATLSTTSFRGRQLTVPYSVCGPRLRTPIEGRSDHLGCLLELPVIYDTLKRMFLALRRRSVAALSQPNAKPDGRSRQDREIGHGPALKLATRRASLACVTQVSGEPLVSGNPRIEFEVQQVSYKVCCDHGHGEEKKRTLEDWVVTVSNGLIGL